MAAKKMERQETSRLLGNLPWRRPAGPSWPLEADRKVTPHGQVLPRRSYGYGLTAKTSLRSESVHHCMCPIFHAAAGRRGQKTKQFCETSSFFEVDNTKNEAILRDFFIPHLPGEGC